MYFCCFFFFKQKTAYEMRISDWSSDVCSSDLMDHLTHSDAKRGEIQRGADQVAIGIDFDVAGGPAHARDGDLGKGGCGRNLRSEEHTSELQSLMRISYAVFCLKKKKKTKEINTK